VKQLMPERNTGRLGKTMEGAEVFPIQQITGPGKQDARDIVASERPLKIMLNRRELITLLCTPLELEHLVIGFLFSEGWLNSKEALKEITVDKRQGIARVESQADASASDTLTHDSANLPEEAASRFSLPASRISALVKRFQHQSRLFRASGGTHSAALCDEKNILAFSEDIGRYNAIDKVVGKCILDDIPTSRHLLITSGRVSSRVVAKTARMNIPVLVSRCAPTDRSVELAAGSGITLIGFARGDKMNIYSGGWRIVTRRTRHLTDKGG